MQRATSCSVSVGGRNEPPSPRARRCDWPPAWVAAMELYRLNFLSPGTGEPFAFVEFRAPTEDAANETAHRYAGAMPLEFRSKGQTVKRMG